MIEIMTFISILLLFYLTDLAVFFAYFYLLTVQYFAKYAYFHSKS